MTVNVILEGDPQPIKEIVLWNQEDESVKHDYHVAVFPATDMYGNTNKVCMGIQVNGEEYILNESTAKELINSIEKCLAQDINKANLKFLQGE